VIATQIERGYVVTLKNGWLCIYQNYNNLVFPKLVDNMKKNRGVKNMELSSIIAFSWSAIAGGVYYDTLKATLGDAFSRLDMFKKEDNKEQFELVLSAIVETNEEIKSALVSMAQGSTVSEVTNITTGDIRSGGSVVIGNHNSVGNNK
jgi:hypothetical protein